MFGVTKRSFQRPAMRKAGDDKLFDGGRSGFGDSVRLRLVLST
jgi:hypothetical protein